MSDKEVTITLDRRDAERILLEAATEAAKWGGYLDHVTRKTILRAFGTYDTHRPLWRERFVAAKRVVEAFGVEVEPISEAEMIGRHEHPKPGTGTTYVPSGIFSPIISGYVNDASAAAGRRVVARWKAAAASAAVEARNEKRKATR